MKAGQDLSEVLGKVEYIVGTKGPFMDAYLNMIDGKDPAGPARKAPRKPPSGGAPRR